jgi:hypothetical protein
MNSFITLRPHYYNWLATPLLSHFLIRREACYTLIITFLDLTWSLLHPYYHLTWFDVKLATPLLSPFLIRREACYTLIITFLDLTWSFLHPYYHLFDSMWSLLHPYFHLSWFDVKLARPLLSPFLIRREGCYTLIITFLDSTWSLLHP